MGTLHAAVLTQPNARPTDLLARARPRQPGDLPRRLPRRRHHLDLARPLSALPRALGEPPRRHARHRLHP